MRCIGYFGSQYDTTKLQGNRLSGEKGGSEYSADLRNNNDNNNYNYTLGSC